MVFARRNVERGEARRVLGSNIGTVVQEEANAINFAPVTGHHERSVQILRGENKLKKTERIQSW